MMKKFFEKYRTQVLIFDTFALIAILVFVITVFARQTRTLSNQANMLTKQDSALYNQVVTHSLLKQRMKDDSAKRQAANSLRESLIKFDTFKK